MKLLNGGEVKEYEPSIFDLVADVVLVGSVSVDDMGKYWVGVLRQEGDKTAVWDHKNKKIFNIHEVKK